jgi:hypothetical protein
VSLIRVVRQAAATVPSDVRASRRDVVRRLLLGSFLMLYLELALIRWLGSNIAHLSYFSNFVLLGSFLGIGIGFLVARREWSILRLSPVLLAFLVAFTATFPVTIDQTDDNVIYFTSLAEHGPPSWLVLPIVFAMAAAIMAAPAEIVGRCFARLKPLEAYRYDLLGSLCGIGLFSLLSFLRAPSVVWGAIVATCFIVLLGKANRFLTVATGGGLVAVLLIECLRPGISWSPYYKVKTETVTQAGVSVVQISVNGIPHQQVWDREQRLALEPQYGLPYTHLNGQSLDNVLVVGAGSGSDVAIALSKGARHVDAVDIDPRILEIGAERNPNHPYQDPRVTRYVDDGRAFLSSHTTRYDLILFALPDSLALVSGASQIRLESYLFTEEALIAARDHLTSNGMFAMYNYYREDWLIQRLAGTVQSAFGHEPCVDLVGGGQAVVAAAVSAADQVCAPSGSLAADVVAPASDDHPFLYFRGDSIPSIYLWVIGGILLLSLLAIRKVGGPLREMRPYLDLFFMGAAFLLLETKSVATFALLFGTTWFVNALVFAGVLVVVLVAVEVTARFRTPPAPLVFAGIAVSLGAAYVVRPEWLLSLPSVPRLIIAVVLAFTPIFLANVAFAKRFSQEGDSRAAFAVNLLGAILGGCLEYLSLLTGYRNLLLLVGALYALAFLCRPRQLRSTIQM